MLTLLDARELTLDVHTESFMGGTFAYSASSIRSGRAGSMTGSAYDRHESLAVSRALGEAIERQVSERVCRDNGWDLGRASLSGELGTAYHFTRSEATSRAQLELVSRGVRARAWSQTLRLVRDGRGAFVCSRLRDLTGRDFVMLRAPNDSQWLGLASAEKESKVLFSDAYSAESEQRVSHAVREHIMLLAALRSERCTTATTGQTLDDFIDALTEAEDLNSTNHSPQVVVGVHEAYRGFVAVATYEGWDGEAHYPSNPRMGTLDA